MKINCRISGVPRITSIYTFTAPLSHRLRDIRPNATASPSGSANKSVSRKISRETSVPHSICSSILSTGAAPSGTKAYWTIVMSAPNQRSAIFASDPSLAIADICACTASRSA